MIVKLLFIIIRVGELKLIRQSIILFLGEPLTMGFGSYERKRIQGNGKEGKGDGNPLVLSFQSSQN